MYKKAWCTFKIVVLVIKPIAFLTFSLPSLSSDLKVPIISFRGVYCTLGYYLYRFRCSKRTESQYLLPMHAGIAWSVVTDKVQITSIAAFTIRLYCSEINSALILFCNLIRMEPHGDWSSLEVSILIRSPTSIFASFTWDGIPRGLLFDYCRLLMQLVYSTGRRTNQTWAYPLQM